MDSVYRPISDADEESETHATTDQPVASWSKFKDELESGVDQTALTVDQAVDETVRRRQQQDTSPETAHERPITRLRSRGGPQSLKEASDDLLAAGYSEGEIQQLSAAVVEAAERGDDLRNPPPDVVELPREFGETGNEPLDASEAADKLTEWRQQEAQRREAELAELTGEHAARQQPPEQQPEPEQQQQPQKPDPVQQERQQLAQERARINALKSMEGHEASLRNSYDKLVANILQEFPGLQNGPPSQAELEELRQQAPARFNQLAAADNALRQYQGQIAHLAQQRSQRDQQQALSVRQQRAAFRAKQDADFDQRAERIAGAQWKQNSHEMQNAALQTLKAAGLTQQQISDLWSGDDSIDMHSAVLQEVLLKASMWDRAQDKARQIRQTPMPSVIKPGTGNFSRSNGDNVNELRARMRSAKGGDGLKLGVALLRAQRANRD
jgi:uncharacterized protein YdcH (DUF465 family)